MSSTNVRELSKKVFDFDVTYVEGAARAGVLTTAHGEVQTPAFMPVGTQGAVKGVTHRDLDDLGAEMLLSNTYHLYLRPGADLIARRGGLHRFIAWTKPILTDSGGYQVFSLAARRTIDEQGVRFQSHLDGSSHLLTPESVTDIQAALGSDIAMVLDECLAHPSDVATARASMQRTIRWARRARSRMLTLRSASVEGVTVTNPNQAQFGIVQGGVFPELRQESAGETVAIGFEAYAIGGLSVGEPPDVMYDIVGRTASWLPRRPAALPDGRGDAGRSRRVSGEGGRSLRLRPAHTERPQRPAVYQRGAPQHQERAVRRGRPAARRGLLLLHVPDLFPGLPAASVHGRRNERGDP